MEASFFTKTPPTPNKSNDFFLHLAIFTILYVCIFAWDHKLSTHMARLPT